MSRFSKSSAVILALTVALGACTDGIGLNDTPFDASVSAGDLQAVQGAFAATVFESLALSSQSFGLVADTGAVPVSLLQASLAAASSGSRWEAAAAAQAFAAAGPAAGALLHLDLRGRTYDRDVDGQLFATITVDGDAVTVQNSTGGALTAAEAEAVRRIFDGLQEMFDDRFEDFVRPVAWMFEAA
ncbi:MAG: hypothetical protein IIC36_06100 [Gemmatimonadetes bacterium]|nr:hypothetical protein [Gemmatimonadota bacterium]